jgi:hypothetical protein
MYQYEKSRKAQLHEKSFSWFEGIGAFLQQAKKAFCTYKCTACQLAIFNIVRVESYAKIEHKRLLMTKELQSIWRIRKNGKYKI